MRTVNAAAATDAAALTEAFRGCDAVVTSVGNRQPGFEYYSAAAHRNVVDAMGAAGVQRLVMISSTGCGESWPPLRWSWVGVLFKWFLRLLLRDALRDLDAAEVVVRESDVDYLILRPSGVSPDRAPLERFELLEEPPASKSDGVHFEVAKEDVALCALQEALSPTLHRAARTIGHSFEDADAKAAAPEEKADDEAPKEKSSEL
uniref:NAD(P)-binding domain-containing protein n=2 Tax=Phaeomonas parva TaxID=124430 RepID=A0A7S1TTP6_9STRA|mmetsp:Transcript_16599/g.50974  ORF Transcript_16599/g.50974 Transcript_16599/m.50974 type:complete len:204 (+) Transcript_16599:220-831(+)